MIVPLPVGGLLGAAKRSSSVESPNKAELGLALEGGTPGFVVFGLEENNSSSSCSLSNKSAPFLVTAGLSVEIKENR